MIPISVNRKSADGNHWHLYWIDEITDTFHSKRISKFMVFFYKIYTKIYKKRIISL